MKRKKVLLVHQAMRPAGGATSVAAWVVEALKEEHELTILTWDSIDTSALNRFYGTSLRDEEFQVLIPSSLLRFLRRADPDERSLLPLVFLMRICRRIRNNYDLVIGTAPVELDLGAPALLYVHYPCLGQFWGAFRDCHGVSLAARLGFLLTRRTRPWIVLSGFSLERLKRHTMLANSDWTGSKIETFYGVRVATLYPPVSTSSPARPWEERENGFLCSGRFHRRKRLDWIVHVLASVRRKVPDLTLHIAGTRESTRDGACYFEELSALVASHPDWIRLHEDLSRHELDQLTGSLRYGIHARIEEHFGIAPAETLAAGCIPFVHASGGQVEIVGGDPRLCFTDEEDAAEKIAAVMKCGFLQREILNCLSSRRGLFTTEKFIAGFRHAVRDLLAY